MTHTNAPVTSAEIDRAVAALRSGHLVAIPTETVYGLAADANNERAVARVFELKGRPADRPVIVHLATGQDVAEWAWDVPDYATKWMDHFWPGPLTLVFRKRSHVSDLITAGQPTVACRVPAHPVARSVLERSGRALVAPSANRYGQISPTTAQAVRDEFGAEAPLVLDGGPCNIGIESTIVACLGPEPVVLRVGMVTAQALEAVGHVRVAGSPVRADVAVPGQVASHYAPHTPCLWVNDMMGVSACLAHLSDGAQVGYLGWEPPHQDLPMTTILADEPKRAAQQLYAALRELDGARLDYIVICAPPEGACWDGIRDRLKRASTPSQHRPTG